MTTIQRYRRIISSDKKERLDVFLAREIGDLSRSWIQKLIRDAAVQVNEKKVSPSYRLKKGDVVTARLSSPPEISLDPDSTLNSRIRVVFESEEYIVIEKPAGLVVHPSESTPRGTLVNWLLWKYPEVRDVGEDRLRPGIVHRLDKETSGLMVIARTNDAFEWLKRQFKNRTVSKRYTALVYGEVRDERGDIRYPIARSVRNPRVQVAHKSPSRTPTRARDAHTRWRVLKLFPGLTLLELSLVTGRKHQLRVHLKAIDHPVVGDDLYTTKEFASDSKGNQSRSAVRHIGRMFLHASSLRFPAPDGEWLSFTSSLPPELDRALNNVPYMVG